MATPLSTLTAPVMWVARRIVRRLAPRFTIGVTAILFDDQGLVYVQRHRFWPRQAYGFPGGFLARNESCEEAARREVLEETGLRVTKLTLLGVDKSAPDHQNVFFVGHIHSMEGFRIQKLEVLHGRFVDPAMLPEPFLRAHKSYFESHLSTILSIREA
ncbi:NUDIX hydrolase [Myxococcota bacterium]|nr:NUDIX hydrolase [Myxococcota bacterium]